MKKRILALLLTVCMLVLSVPMFVLPVTAAEEAEGNYKTSFNSTTNLPTVNGDGTYTATGAWVPMGYLRSNGYNVPGKAYVLNTKTHTGIAATNEHATYADWPGGAIKGWAQKGTVLVALTAAPNAYFHTPGQLNPTYETSVGIRYNVEKKGTINITLDKLGNFSDSENSDAFALDAFRYGIFVNGTMVWPVEGGTLSETDALTENKTNLLAVTDLNVKAGDVIDFICEVEKATPKNIWNGAGNIMFPTIEYTYATKVAAFNTGSNFPVVNEDGTVTYSGGFTAVGYPADANGNFNFTNYPAALTMNKQSALWNKANGQVGIAHDYIPGTASAIDWNKRAHMVIKGFNQNWFANAGEIVVTKSMAAAVRYTAESAGIVDIDFTKIGNTLANSGGLSNFVYGVYKNGELIWEAKGADWVAEGQANLSYKENVSVTTDLKIKKGDVIDFTVKAVNPGADLWGKSGGNILFPAITYTTLGSPVEYSTTFNGIAGMPAYDTAAGTVSANGGWMPMAYTKTNGYADTSLAHPMNVLNNLIISGNVIAAPSDWPGGTIVGWRNKATLLIEPTNPNNANFFNTAGTFNVTTEQSGGMRYTAEKSGTINIIIDKIANTSLNSGESAGLDKFRYGVFYNGEMIWPVEGGTLSATDALTAPLSDIIVIEDFDVTIGDTIDFIIEAQGTPGSEAINNFSGAGNMFFSTIEYTYVNPNVAIFNSTTNLPKFDADGKVVFSGNFFPMSYVKGDDGFDYSNEDLIIPMDGRSPIMPTSNPYGAVSSVDLRWGGTARSLMVLQSFNVNFFKDLGQINVTGKMSGGIRYVSEETGTLRIDLSRVGNTAPKAAGLDKFSYFVYVNGEKVWGMTGSEIKAQLGGAATGCLTNVPVAADVDVKLGDTIDFIVEGATIGEADPWQGAGNIIFPVITYTNVIPKPTTSANVALGSNFALNVKVNLPEEALETMADFGLLVNGEEFPLIKESDTLYSAHNVLKAYVQDLESDTVTFQPYYITDEGMTIWGNKVTTNIVDVLQAYYNGEDEDVKNIAIATLNYVAEAQRYFDPLLGEDDLANAILAEDERDLSDFDIVAPSETVIITNPDGATVDFTGVSMILNNALALKFHIALPEDADIEEYALAAIDPMTLMAGLDAIDGIPAGAMLNPLKYTEEDGDAVAYFGTTFENMDRMYAFLVINAEGEVVSDIVLYNPLTYATTMVGDIEVGFVCKSLIALNEAIDVYTGAIANR